jgi:hypothetical protein
MGDRAINSQVYKTLLARSGNKCAFPGCPNPIFNQQYVYIAQLCHIEGVAGQRYNPSLSVEEVNSYSNLMFLCYKHHKETDDESLFPVEVLKKMKIDHEAKYILSPFAVDMSHLFSLRKETEEYWKKVEIANTAHHVIPNLKIEIKTNADYTELNKELMDILTSLESLISIFDENAKRKYWEIFNLGFPNHLTKIKVLLEHMNIKFHESHLANNPNDNSIRDELEQLRKKFIDTTAKHTAYAD